MEDESKISLDQIIDIPFAKNVMLKIEAPIVPNIRASSFESVDSIKFEKETSIEVESQDIWERTNQPSIIISK